MDKKQYSKWTEERKIEHRTKQALRGIKKRKELLELYGNKCINCGYNKCEKALHFHHKDPKTKKFNLDSRKIMSHKWQDVLDEAKKCTLLCSNCHTEIHAQKYVDLYLKEYKFFEIKYKSYCIDCNKQITKKSLRCDQCNKFLQRKTIRPSKEELEKLLWEKPTIKIAEQFNVSDKAIEKWSKSYNINKPPRGYWMKNKRVINSIG